MIVANGNHITPAAVRVCFSFAATAQLGQATLLEVRQEVIKADLSHTVLIPVNYVYCAVHTHSPLDVVLFIHQHWLLSLAARNAQASEAIRATRLPSLRELRNSRRG